MKKTFIGSVQKQLKGGWPEDNLGYRVNVGRYSYFIRISPEKDAHGTIREYTLDLGGRKRGCVSIRIPTLSSAIPGRSDATQAVLKYVQYNPMCSANSDRDLISGFGTKHMLKTALFFAKELCPNTDIKSFRYMDVSHKLCPDGVSVDLPYFMIALHCKTYYEKNFFARLEEDSDYEQYNAALLHMNSVPRETMPFDTFVGTFILNEHQIVLRPLYDEAKTFTDFFHSIRVNYADTICQLMHGWVNRFVINWLFSNKDFASRFWIIPSNKITEINVANWEIVSVDSIGIQLLNKEQQGGIGTRKSNQYLGMWDSSDE